MVKGIFVIMIAQQGKVALLARLVIITLILKNVMEMGSLVKV